MPEKPGKAGPSLLPKAVLLSACLVLILLVPLAPWQQVVPQEAGIHLAPSVIRFHVLAHSDDPADQALKNRVRDEVLDFLKPYLNREASLEEVRSLLEREQERLTEILRKLLKRWGSDQEVTLLVGEASFPTRAYAGTVYPAGTYQAFTVVLGDGLGQNWWCVMFPPLCLTELALIPAGDPPLGEEAGEAGPPAGPPVSGEERPLGFRLRILTWFWGLRGIRGN
jgi:stage II sporulation protein R